MKCVGEDVPLGGVIDSLSFRVDEAEREVEEEPECPAQFDPLAII